MSMVEPPTEFDRWMTLDRIARSGFAEILFDGLHDGSWTQDEAMEVATSALRGFGNRCCYFLASAVAHETGWPIIGLMRTSSERLLLHAAVCDPLSGDAFDILGRRPLGQLRDELVVAVGAVRLCALPSLGHDIDADEMGYLRAIAAGLPWMPLSSGAMTRRGWGEVLNTYVMAVSAFSMPAA